MKKLMNLSFLFLSLAIVIVGLTLYTKALYQTTLEGTTTIHSAHWKVHAESYQKFGSNVSFDKIKPGDSGITNLGAMLEADLSDIPTTVVLNYQIPGSLDELEFYLVNNTDHHALKLLKLEGNGSYELDASIFTQKNDLELRWIYPKSSTKPVCGTINYSLVFSQGETLTTYYTDVTVEDLGVYENVEVTVNKSNQTVSFVLIDSTGAEMLTVTDQVYTEGETLLILTLDNGKEVKITIPDVMINP